jgi:2-polyprenyl-6-methoxyphenol hydroxylase-like FAD-dependent oxidoreductase
LTSIVCQARLSIQHPLLQGGYFMMLGDGGSSLFCYRQSDSGPFAYTVHVPSEDDLNAQAPAELLRWVQHATSTWHPPIPELVTAIDLTSVIVRGYYDKEPLTRVREGRLWLIGDAAHPMAPPRG